MQRLPRWAFLWCLMLLPIISACTTQSTNTNQNQSQYQLVTNQTPTPTPTPAPNFSRFAGYWYGHSIAMTIKADGSAQYSGRVYVWCTNDPHQPCDSMNNNTITSGLDTQITFTSVNGNVASGSITGGTGDRDGQGNILPVGSQMTVTLNTNDTLTVSDGRVICGPQAKQNNVSYCKV